MKPSNPSNQSNTYQESTHLLKTAGDDRPFSQDFEMLFSSLAITLPLVSRRMRFQQVKNTFTSVEAISNLESLEHKVSNSMPDPKDVSNIITTTTTTRFSMSKQMATVLFDRFIEARFIQSADESTDSRGKMEICQLTPKGVEILQHFCYHNHIQQPQHVRQLFDAHGGGIRVIFLNRDPEGDKILTDEDTIKTIFREFLGEERPRYNRGPSKSDSFSVASPSRTGLRVGVVITPAIHINGNLYQLVFRGAAAFDWLMNRCTIVERDEALEIGKLFCKYGLISCVDETAARQSFSSAKSSIYFVTEKGENLAMWQQGPESFNDVKDILKSDQEHELSLEGYDLGGVQMLDLASEIPLDIQYRSQKASTVIGIPFTTDKSSTVTDDLFKYIPKPSASDVILLSTENRLDSEKQNEEVYQNPGNTVVEVVRGNDVFLIDTFEPPLPSYSLASKEKDEYLQEGQHSEIDRHPNKAQHNLENTLVLPYNLRNTSNQSRLDTSSCGNSSDDLTSDRTDYSEESLLEASDAADFDRFLLFIMVYLRRDITDRVLHMARDMLRSNQGQHTHTSGGNSSSTRSESDPGGSSDLQNQPNRDNNRGTKRAFDEGDQGKSGGGGNDDQNKQPKPDVMAMSLRFACPFFKRNSQKYSERRSCRGPGWGTVHRVKEHLYRNHGQSIKCFRCFQSCQDEATLKRHLQAETPCQRGLALESEEDGFDKDQEEKLRCRKRPPGQTEKDRWIEMYRVLFPNVSEEKIPSPYHETDVNHKKYTPEVLDRYENFLQQELPPRIAQEIEYRLQISLLNDEVRLALPAIIGVSVRDSFRSIRAELQRPSVNSAPLGGTAAEENVNFRTPITASTREASRLPQSAVTNSLELVSDTLFSSFDGNNPRGSFSPLHATPSSAPVVPASWMGDQSFQSLPTMYTETAINDPQPSRNLEPFFDALGDLEDLSESEFPFSEMSRNNDPDVFSRSAHLCWHDLPQASQQIDDPVI